MSKLWYKTPAKEWEEALPLGNGRIGAMVYGHVADEVIQVNEESIWYGAPINRINPNAKSELEKIRKYIFEGDINSAERLMKYALSGTPDTMHPYQTLGTIELHFYNHNEISSYNRELDLSTAMYKQSYETNGTLYTRQIFISHEADAMIMYFRAEGDGLLSFDAILRRAVLFDGSKAADESSIYLYGNLGKGGSDFGMTLSAKSIEGSVSVIGDHLIVNDAKEVTLYFTASSSYQLGEAKDICAHNLEVINKAKSKTIGLLTKEHLDDYQELYNRVNLSLEGAEKFEAEPTDVRLVRAFKKGNADIGLIKTYFDYGRYLLISCSRKGGLPATLQGLWNKDFTPPWESKYTVNINAQMNYWPALVCGLEECHEPLFTLIKKVAENGRRTAEEMYGCRGFVCHHNTDIFGDTAPCNHWIPGTYWVMGSAWLCTHIWTHYEYTCDKDFLKEYYPIMIEAAKFYLDFLVEHHGYLVTCPSVSPENTFILPNGQQGSNIYGVTMDNQILRDLFTECIMASEVLENEDPMIDDIKSALNKLMPTMIGREGQILEWPHEYEEAEPGHRHISHLYGLYPSDQISVDKTPELAKAARVTLERRLKNGGGHTGWSRAWIINHYAKLWDGESAYSHLLKLFESSTYLNMFDKHPPFQIDGNFGATAGIANMLVQSDAERIVVLPALPKALKTGSVKGLRIKGAGIIDIEWKNGKLIGCNIRFKNDRRVTIKYDHLCMDFDVTKDDVISFKPGIRSKFLVAER